MFIPRIHSKKAKVFAPLINQYGPALMAFVGRIVTCQEDAEDVVQEAFVTAYEHLNDFDPEKASLKTWLHRLAYHEALHHLRRRKRLLELPLDVGEDIPDELPDTTTAEQLDEAILKLTPEDQMLLQLYYFDQRPLKEIAYITGSIPSTIGSRLHRIRKKLDRIIKPQIR